MAIDLDKMTLPEIFQHVSELPAGKRPTALKAIGDLTPQLKVLLKYTYRKDIVFDLPEGTPPYNEMETPQNMGHNRLPREMRKLEYFLPGNNLSSIKREGIFINLLESLSPEEAKLVLMVKNKKLTYKGFNRKLVEEVFPELFAGEA
jgi:hypothetical protein